MNPQHEPLFEDEESVLSLPAGLRPELPPKLRFERIYLTRGSLKTSARRKFVRGICACFPDAEIVRDPDTPHNRVDLGEPDPLRRHRAGKRTLVFAEHQSAVRFSDEAGNTCPNYWHFSPYGFCPYDCQYCYLAGTQGVWYSPTVKIYVNLPEILGEIDRTAAELARPTAFYLGKLQDGLALDPLTAYSTVTVPFFAAHEFARQVILTKSTAVDRLLPLCHEGHTILTWSLTPPAVAEVFETGTPSPTARVTAMERCTKAGYPIRAVLMPIIPVEGWQQIYARFVLQLLETVPLQRLTLGGICSYRHSRRLMERKLGSDNNISRHMQPAEQQGDGRMRYPQELRVRLYSHIIRAARSIRPDLEVALCLEERTVWEALGLQGNIGKCNCVL